MIGRAPSREFAPLLLVATVCAAAGGLAATRAPLVPFVALGAATIWISLRWRAGVIVLLVLLPFSGVPAFIAGSTGLAARDLLVVTPLYAGFAVEMTRAREPLLPRLGIALPALAAFAALVLLYVPAAPTTAAGALAVRVWLAYIPMLAVGYTYVRRIDDAERIFALTALIGLIPAAIGIAECALAAHTGRFGVFERMYGASPIDDAGRFVVLSTAGDGSIRIPRVPATFTSVSQYYGFAIVAFACALSILLRRRNIAWLAVAAVLGAAALASGARAAYVMVPAIAVASLLADAPRPSRIIAIVSVGAAVGALVLAVSGDPVAIARAIPGHVAVTLATASSEMRDAFAFAGHGAGWDTNAALRYGGVADRRYIENWYAKAILELGLPGLIAIVAAFAGIAATLGRAYVLASSTAARALAAPQVILLVATMAALFKGPYIDLDPLNVYFWLLLGATFALFELPDNAPRHASVGAGLVPARAAGRITSSPQSPVSSLQSPPREALP